MANSLAAPSVTPAPKWANDAARSGFASIAVPNLTMPVHVSIASRIWTAVKSASSVMAGVFEPGNEAVSGERDVRARCGSAAQGVRAHDASLNNRTYAGFPWDVIVAGSAPIRRCGLQTPDREIPRKSACLEVFVRNEILLEGDIRQRSPHGADSEGSHGLEHTLCARGVQ